MAVLSAIGNGVLFGLLLALLIGPVFFALIQTSMEKGFASGVGMALGIALSDTLYIIIASLGVAMMANNQNFHMWLGWIGGLIMLIFGLVNLFKKVRLEQGKRQTTSRTDLYKEFVKGFLLNGVNPFVLLFWIGVATAVALNYQYTTELSVVFFTAIILTVMLLDFAKAYAANKLSRLLSPQFMTWLNRVVGLALIVFSIKLFHFALEAMEKI